MLKRLFKTVSIFVFFTVFAYGADSPIYLDKTKLVTQQIELLKSRLAQSKNIQVSRDTVENVNKRSLSEAELDVLVAQSNLDNINIEVVEAQQTITQLEKNIQDSESQINALNVFGLKVERNGAPNINRLRVTLDHQQALLALQKIRLTYLVNLQELADNTLQLYKAKYAHIAALLKSRTIVQMKEQQARSEIGFQQQQSYWLEQLNKAYAQLKLNQSDKNRSARLKIERDIFYANENINFIYLRMLITRYQDEVQQLKISISRSNSITLLNKVSEQTQILSKQLARMDGLLKTRMGLLERRKDFLLQDKMDFSNLLTMENQYKQAIADVANVNQQLVVFRASLDQALHQELSARQGLPAIGAKAWVDLGGEILLVPTLAFQVVKNLTQTFIKNLESVSYIWWLLLCVFEAIWWVGVCFSKKLLAKIVLGIPDHEYGHINLKWLFIKLIHRNLIDIAVIGNLIWLFLFSGISLQSFNFIVNLGLVWLLFKMAITMARLSLVETMHDSDGHDVRLYHRLKWTCLVGGVVTALTVFVHQLPVMYEVKDLFDRLFLLFLLVVSVFLLKSWEVLPNLILSYIDQSHAYLKRVVRLLGLVIPLILLTNSAIGLFGFVNLIQAISRYESIFLFVLVGYLVLRGVLNDGMEIASKMLIRHVSNGWLWTEAFLKPIDRVLRIVLFLMAWVVLFLFYGWDKQSPVVERLNTLLSYRLINILNTVITPLNIIELLAVLALLYWAARWTREFVFRLLLSRTKDLGLRNSIAILSQYTTIVIGIFICLRVLGIDLRALTVVATGLAFGVGLGLRDLVNNFACGFLLLIERPLRVGDIVSINGYEGDVMHIGGRAVTIRTWDHMEVLIPNAEIFSKAFTNWTAKDNVVRSSFTIKINRHDNPHDVQVIILQVLENHKDVLGDPAPEVLLNELADGLIEFEIRYYVNLRQIKSRIGVKSEVLLAIWDTFEKHGIQPPYPHHEVHLQGQLPLHL